jgi:hypothetical protein
MQYNLIKAKLNELLEKNSQKSMSPNHYSSLLPSHTTFPRRYTRIIKQQNYKNLIFDEMMLSWHPVYCPKSSW